MADEIDNERVKDAWDRIARTQDGIIAYRHLQRIRLGIAPARIDHGALQMLEGRRSLAADLMAFMSEGIAENDRACVTFAVAKPSPVSTNRGAGPRISADTFVPGYDIDRTGTAYDRAAGGTGDTGAGSNGTGNSTG